MRAAVVLGTNLAVGAAVLAWVLHRHGAAAAAVLAREPCAALLVAFLAVAAATVLTYALRWRLLLGGLDARRPAGALVAYRMAGQSLSSLIPTGKLGGEPVRALLLVRSGVSGASAIASVAVDRTLEMGAAAGFACTYAVILLARGVPGLGGALVTVSLAAVALGTGVVLTVRRLRRGAGLVTALAAATGLTRLRIVRERLDVLKAAEDDTARLVADPGRMARAFAVGVLANGLVLLEYAVLLAALGLPSGPLAVVAAVFATGAAHSLPVPAAIGALEGAQMWLFQMLGHPPEVGLAVGLAVRLRELVWLLPGLVYLVARALPALTASGHTPPR